MKKKRISLGLIIISIVLIITGVILSFIEKDTNPNESSNDTQKKIYKINESATIDYIKITLINSSEYYDYKKCSNNSSDNGLELLKPTFDLDCIDILDNQKIQKVTFELKGLKDNQLINATNFKCIADNKEYIQVYGLEKKEFSNVLMVGDNVTGSIYCQIPKDAKNIKIKYINDNSSEISFEI